MALAHEPEVHDPRLRLLRAAGDGARLALLDRLCRGEVAVGTLVTDLGLPQPLVSRHLRILREAGWVRAERQGQRMIYRLDPEAPHHVRAWAAGLPHALFVPPIVMAPPPHAPSDDDDDLAADDTHELPAGVLFVD